MSLETFAQKLSANSLSEYIAAAKLLDSKLDNNELKPRVELKVAILSSFTTQGLDKVLYVEAAKSGIRLKTYSAGYNQYAQEILNPSSNLFQSKPEIIFLFVDIRSIFGDLLLTPYSQSAKDQNNQVEQRLSELLSVLDSLQKSSPATIVVHNLCTPSYSPLGILEMKQAQGIRKSICDFNEKLAEYAYQNSQVFVFDYENFASEIGKNNLVDSKYYYIADMRLDTRHFQSLAKQYLSYIRPLCGVIRKCISVDLDNTLWGGVIGEDGMQGIKLGANTQGLPFIEFQKTLLSLYNRGVVLAINSKNNLNDALEVIRNHPDMILREKHFSVICANWNEKVDNLKEIANKLNIGLDSIVHIDDDQMQSEIIRKELPQVFCLQLPPDPAYYVEALRKLTEFNTLQITSEDLNKNAQYAAEKQRKELVSTSTDINQYLADLGIVVEINLGSDFLVPRIAQLSQKTNQFNMTTKRYSDDQIKKMITDPNFLIVTAKVSDKFGDSGLTGLVIVNKSDAVKWTIDTFLLSCRVIGRRVEETLLAFLVESASNAGAKELIGEFIKTEKNDPAQDFYKRTGFVELTKANQKQQFFQYKIDRGYQYPENIKCIKGK